MRAAGVERYTELRSLAATRLAVLRAWKSHDSNQVFLPVDKPAAWPVLLIGPRQRGRILQNFLPLSCPRFGERGE
jgi:hypothetical protein